MRALRARWSDVALVAAGWLLCSMAGAQTRKMTVRFDPAATEIHWTLKGTTHTTHGSFRLKAGLLTFDPANGVAEGELLVDLASGGSGNPKRDAKMQKEVLESGKYPQAFFHPIKINGALKPGEAQSVSVDGTFNIHGADHPVSMGVQAKLEGTLVTATTHFTVPYVAWGMKDPSALLLRVGKEVAIDIVAHGTVEGSGLPADAK